MSPALKIAAEKQARLQDWLDELQFTEHAGHAPLSAGLGVLSLVVFGADLEEAIEHVERDLVRCGDIYPRST